MSITKGKWEVESIKGIPEYVVVGGESRTIIFWTGFHDRPSDIPVSEREANARLIAVAPELLQACIKAVEPLSEGEDCGLSVDTYNFVCNAIARAGGVDSEPVVDEEKAGYMAERNTALEALRHIKDVAEQAVEEVE